MSLSKEEYKRYDRHIRLSEVGEAGQERLKNASVLVIGAGGLGCPVLQYLTAAGVGKIGIVDGDVVSASNLQRQVLYGHSDIGQYKVEVAVCKLKDLNPYVKFVVFKEFLSVENALEIIEKFDIVIDGSDNFPTRYVVNDACVIANKPLVFGSIFKFEGQVSVFNYQEGPSYRCLYPEPPSEGEVPNCSEIGVLGVLPGYVGTLMVNECLKMILSIGEVMNGKLLIVNSLKNTSLLINISRDEANFNKTTLQEISKFDCLTASKTPNKMKTITPKELKDEMDHNIIYQLIDVREAFEYEICAIVDSLHIPLNKIPNSLSLIRKDIPVVFICHHGMRSASAIHYLESEGFNNLLNLSGGIDAWAREVDDEMEIY